MAQIGRNRRHLFSIAMGLAVVVIVGSACSNSDESGDSSATGPTTTSEPASSSPKSASLVVELDWVPNPDHVGLYYAQEKGYFDDAALTIEFRPPSNAADPIKLVGLNKVDLAITYQPEMFYGQQNGLPVIAVATVVPVPLNSMIVAPGQTVTSLDQISGKSVGVTGVPSDDAFYTTMLKTAGLTTDDVEKVNVGFNLVPSILSNKVAAIIGGFRNVEAIQIEQESGTAPTVFPADELGVPNYAELVVAANSDRLASDAAYADAVTRFVATLVQGTDHAITDPEGATEIMKQVTQYDPTFLDESVPYTLELLTPAEGTHTGCIDVADWQSYGDWMQTNDLIAGVADASAIATDQYLPDSCT